MVSAVSSDTNASSSNNTTTTADVATPLAPAPTSVPTQTLVRLNRKPSFVEKPTTPLKSHRLQPKTLEPLRCSGASAPLSFLSTVERIEINETRVRNGVTYYVLDVYRFHLDSRLPSLRSNPRRASVAPQGEPDFRVERRYSDFSLLREQAFLWSCPNPQFICDYCKEFVTYVRFRVAQPRLITKIAMRTQQRKKMLAAFLADFVALAQFRGYHCGNCALHEHMPHVVEAFVRDEGVDFAASEHVRMSSWR